MREATSSSSSLASDQRLAEIPLDLLEPHPSNSNVMSGELRAKLRTNIARTGEYPPIIVRPSPAHPGWYQLLDGHTRADILKELGHSSAQCYVWPCSGQEALLLLATLNRLEGSDAPAKRASLIRELHDLIPETDLADLLPESAQLIEEALSLIELDEDQIFADLERAALASAIGPALISFAVDRDDEPDIERAIAAAVEPLVGTNRRGRALAAICRQYLEAGDA